MTRCYACDEDGTQIVFRVSNNGREFTLARCVQCSLVFTWPRLQPEQQAIFYEGDYYTRRKVAVSEFINLSRRRRITKLFNTPKSILDIGCGNAGFLMKMREAGWKTSGLEISQSYNFSSVRAAGVQVFQQDLLQSRFPNYTFDVITLWHVFEHLAAPREYLQEIQRILAPGGLLVIEVPNIASWQAQIGASNWFHWDVPRHMIHFSSESLTSLLNTAGFSVQKISYRSFYYDVFGTLQTLLNRITHRKNLLFDIIGGRVNVREHKVDTAITIVFTPIFLILGCVLFSFAVVFKKGGVITVYARKSS